MCMPNRISTLAAHALSKRAFRVPLSFCIAIELHSYYHHGGMATRTITSTIYGDGDRLWFLRFDETKERYESFCKSSVAHASSMRRCYCALLNVRAVWEMSCMRLLYSSSSLPLPLAHALFGFLPFAESYCTCTWVIRLSRTCSCSCCCAFDALKGQFSVQWTSYC